MRYLLALLLSILFFSCGSDELGNSKAKKILADCLKQKPEQRWASFRVGKATFRNQDYDNELLDKYIQLMEEGYLEMELIREFKSFYKQKEYSIKLTEKSLEYMEKVPENSGNARAKAFNYVVDEVLEVHETPATNTAEVRVSFKADDVTPFAVFYPKDPNEFWVEKLRFTKTSNGWKYCDDFD